VLSSAAPQLDKNPTPQPYSFGWFDWFCLWYPPGWLILFNRHWQHYRDDPDGWRWFEYGLFLIPGGFYLAMLIRWLRLGGRSPSAQPAQPDPAYQRAFQQEILTPIARHYFQSELHYQGALPSGEALIVAMNHAGMCFPWDFMILGLLLSQEQGWFVQPLAHPIFFDHPWLVWWLPAGWTETLGGVRAERPSFAAAIAQKATVLYAPEGWRGLAKGWQQRYQLDTFDPSFVRLSLSQRVPILPVVCMGNEYLHPYTVNVRLLARWFKLPMFPISPLLLIFVLFPSMGVWVMRSRLRYYIQPLWCPWEEERQAEEGGEEDMEADSPLNRAVAYRMAEGLRSRLQVVINQLRNQPPGRS
jgi:1-acyl-sn-glycerol-3-phosphate acyltransferase